MRSNRIVFVFLFATLAGAASAATLAVGVRPVTEHEQTELLVELIEQGAMDAMFESGHIVFDLSVDPAEQFYSYQSIVQSRVGGAAYTVLFDVSFTVSGQKGLYPAVISITLMDADDEELLLESAVAAESIAEFVDIDALALAEAMGSAAAIAVVETLTGGR